MKEVEILKKRLDRLEDYGRQLMNSKNGMYSGHQLRKIGESIVLLSARNPPR